MKRSEAVVATNVLLEILMNHLVHIHLVTGAFWNRYYEIKSNLNNAPLSLTNKNWIIYTTLLRTLIKNKRNSASWISSSHYKCFNFFATPNLCNKLIVDLRYIMSQSRQEIYLYWIFCGQHFLFLLAAIYNNSRKLSFALLCHLWGLIIQQNTFHSKTYR